MVALEHIGVTPKARLTVTWTMEKGSGVLGPFDGVDEACREAQNVLRTHRIGTVSVNIGPHIDPGAG